MILSFCLVLSYIYIRQLFKKYLRKSRGYLLYGSSEYAAHVWRKLGVCCKRKSNLKTAVDVDESKIPYMLNSRLIGFKSAWHGTCAKWKVERDKNKQFDIYCLCWRMPYTDQNICFTIYTPAYCALSYYSFDDQVRFRLDLRLIDD